MNIILSFVWFIKLISECVVGSTLHAANLIKSIVLFSLVFSSILSFLFPPFPSSLFLTLSHVLLYLSCLCLCLYLYLYLYLYLSLSVLCHYMVNMTPLPAWRGVGQTKRNQIPPLYTLDQWWGQLGQAPLPHHRLSQ